MSQIALVRRPTAPEVRAWAIGEGLAQPGQGRLSQKAIDAFNKGRKGVHRYERHTVVRRHAAKPARGRTVERNYDPSAAREWARAEGYRVGERGKLADPVLTAYVLFLAGIEN